MESVKQRFSELGNLVDGVHSVFDRLCSDGVQYTGVDEDTFYRAKLAAHEWVANIVQHASFGDRTPEIDLDVYPNGNKIECVFEDNSDGFDLDAMLEQRSNGLNPLPERGMGLLMLSACTSELSYEKTEDGVFRLRFSVYADEDPWLTIPF
jgi:serine/threonine-protein kinase RsbW